MIRSLSLIAALVVLGNVSPVSAEQKSFPEKEPVLAFDLPEKWTFEPKSGNVWEVSSPSGRFKIRAEVLPVAASMEEFKKCANEKPGMFLKTRQVEEPSEATEQGFSGFREMVEFELNGNTKAHGCWALIKVNEKSSLWVMSMIDEDNIPREEAKQVDKFLDSVKRVTK